ALPSAPGPVRAPGAHGLMAARAQGWLAIAGVVAAGVVLTLVVQERYHHRVLTLVFLGAAMGLAWNIISGYAGQISFGYQVFFGIGADVTVLLVVQAGLTPWIGMVVAVGVAVLAAALIGIPTFRLAGIYFGLATLAYPLIFRIVMDWLGYQEVAIPMMREQPGWFMQFNEPRSFDLLALGVLAATLARFGLLVTSATLVVSLVGGTGTLWGPLIGAALMVPVSEILDTTVGDRLPGIQGVVHGAALMLIMLGAPEGLYWRVRQAIRFRTDRGAEATRAAIVAPPARERVPRPPIRAVPR